ncbi:hypothetical protein [Chamaesiphon minutus]|uniref:Uncharacterized protein n=1 Tax=Chamaesiphon minutus (strain ATCC 27169 / PCC 6605) TaxID=1173020 RepID=K9UHV1_CHAP6|nr:hypothetical protein [Chamaesiphon minutus]AFY94380.1 hypothetical protein Cha6605_3380 [Chamaesiphon minutus PCC 6605]
MKDKTLVQLKIQDDRGSIINAHVEYFSPSWPDWILEFTSPITEKLSFTATDVFECLTQLRLELAKHGCKPLCAGARLDVYLSGMHRDMGSGLSAQIMSLGSEVDWKDLQVGIFDYAEPDSIASVEEQWNYYGSLFLCSYELKIQHHNGSIVEGIIHESRILEPNNIKFTSVVTPDIQANGTNGFECLAILRVELEKYGYRPLCNGARCDAYALPMDIDDGGIFVHILTIGKLPNQVDRVDTFDYAEPPLIVSVAEQRKNYESWIDSIKSVPESELVDYL